MGKRTYLADTIMLALLYRYQYLGSTMIKYEQVKQYDQIINENLELINSKYGISVRNPEYEDSNFYFLARDEENTLYVILSPAANLKDAWNWHIDLLSTDIIIAAQMPNALAIINLQLENGQITKLEKSASRAVSSPKTKTKSPANFF